jgi:two-component system, sensor histidine kinase PdtaS
MSARVYIVVLACFLSTVSVFSQNESRIDSLKKELKHALDKAKVLNEISREYTESSPKESFNYAKKAAEEAIRKNDNKQLADAIWMIARYYLLINEYDKSNLYCDSAKELYHQVKLTKSEINCMVMKANTLFLQARYPESLALFKMGAKESDKAGARDIYCSAILNIGRIYQNEGNYDSSLYYFEKARLLANDLNNKYLEGNACGFIGLVYQSQKKYLLAIDYILNALNIFEKDNILTKVPYWFTSLGDAYKDNNNFGEAVRYYHQAIGQFIKINDRWGLQEAYHAAALAFMGMGLPDSAWSYNTRSLNLCMEINERSGEEVNLNDMGEILISRHRYNEALLYLQKALKLNDEVSGTPDRVDILHNLGTCYVETGSVNEGILLLMRGLALADSLNLQEAGMDLHKELSATYAKTGSFLKALQHHEAYSALSDSLFREESNRHFVEMEQRFQSEQRQKEISQLKLDKVEQEATIRSQRWLWMGLLLGFIFALTIGILLYRGYRIRKKADSEKEALLKEIHHRVKNNLQIISSLLSIQTENITDERVVSAVLESQGRVKAMALIHQLLYQEEELTRISFRTYLPQLVNTVSSIFKKDDEKVELEVEVGDIAFDIDTSIPLGLIVTELASNAFKYAFGREKEGRLKVNLESAGNGKYVLTVADNGKGLPPGIRIDELNSMGLRLVKMLTGQLDGELEYYYNKGAIFTVSFSETI